MRGRERGGVSGEGAGWPECMSTTGVREGGGARGGSARGGEEVYMCTAPSPSPHLTSLPQQLHSRLFQTRGGVGPEHGERGMGHFFFLFVLTGL